ncbi:hypothetical protein HNR00_004499 [Methylorubrum rhodinum]|uniref:Uncharacterized protein n=1 Tax=Methylorubrum rhodinum TaxID=29428 RepID=A0A840ZRW6_9HYPH|nr:hypothetical protein [Methylorubrum rhodinum]
MGRGGARTPHPAGPDAVSLRLVPRAGRRPVGVRERMYLARVAVRLGLCVRPRR